MRNGVPFGCRDFGGGLPNGLAMSVLRRPLERFQQALRAQCAVPW